jgi:hypothetical protein
LPVIYNAGKHLSLDRQLFLLSGILLLVGLLFALILSWIWFIVPIAIGTLLIYKGTTGGHKLTPWLLRLPWNKTPVQPTSAKI